MEKPFERRSHLTTANAQPSVACRRDSGAMRDLWLPSAAPVALCVFRPEAEPRVLRQEEAPSCSPVGTAACNAALPTYL